MRKQLENSTISEIILKHCKNANIRAGHFAIVVIPPDKNYVYKFWVSDYGYETFLSLKSEIGPKILSYSNIKLDLKSEKVSSIRYAKIEKLIPITTKLWEDKCIKFDDGEESFMCSLSSFAGDASRFDKDDLDMILKSSSNNPQIQKLLDHLPLIYRTGIAEGFMNDLRQDNLMVRTNGDIIISDPYASLNQPFVVRLPEFSRRAILQVNKPFINRM